MTPLLTTGRDDYDDDADDEDGEEEGKSCLKSPTIRVCYSLRYCYREICTFLCASKLVRVNECLKFDIFAMKNCIKPFITLVNN